MAGRFDEITEERLKGSMIPPVLHRGHSHQAQIRGGHPGPAGPMFWPRRMGAELRIVIVSAQEQKKQSKSNLHGF